MIDQRGLEEKCRETMERTRISNIIWHDGWKRWVIDVDLPSIKLISLWPNNVNEDTWEIILELHPGDTINQARNFYQHLEIDKFLDLEKNDWSLKSFFHLASSYRNIMWIEAADLKGYLQFWKDHSEKLQQVRKEEFEETIEFFVKHGMVTESEKRQFDEEFTNSGKTVLRVCPGVSLIYRWKKEKVKWDDDFVKQVMGKVEEALVTWV